MERTNELVTAAEARAEGLSLDGVANNRCITKQQFVDNLPGGGIADAIDLLNSSLDGNTVLLFNNTTTDITLTIQTINMYNKGQTSYPELPASSMLVFPISGAVKIIKLSGDYVIGSNSHIGLKSNGVANVASDIDHSTNTLTIGSNNAPISYCLAVVCINNT